MKLKLRLNHRTLEAVREELDRAGFEIDENASLTLTEDDYQSEKLRCRGNGETSIIPVSDILFIESLGHDVFVYPKRQAENQKTEPLRTELRLYKLERLLPPKEFIRISNSVIISRDAIQKIRPALSSRFYLTLTDGSNVDVTRTYYYRFKDFFGI